ncbi:secreted RxLR effector protein 161-like [Lycium ferocissimum]|uniref:secreted RxLR effector protein 161-like n=1 Tax=Lycium ferocissimum TaxID=112874 RepID=UPI002814D87C|nr:secreted RxLR effector protein 161-like [Lycium ferocissimum]
MESDNAEFFENIYPYKIECESSGERPKRPREETKENMPNEENPRRSKRQRTSTYFGPDFLTFLVENEPQTFKEAMSSSEAQYWKENQGQSKSQLDYARVLGSLMYIMNCTRPDIACAISKLSRYTSNPDQTHWMAVKLVLGYLQYTQDYALHYNKYPAVVEGYSDANWITGSSEVKSTSGYVFTIEGGAVS